MKNKAGELIICAICGSVITIKTMKQHWEWHQVHENKQ